MTTRPQTLRDHRRALAWAALVLAIGAGAAWAVGRHPTELAPMTTVEAIGRFDLSAWRWAEAHQVGPLTWLCRALSILGGGLVTIPIRILAAGFLAIRRRWLQLAGFLLTWLVAELALIGLKSWFHRGRPPDPLVDTVGFSFPSGHALGVAATSVALVLAFFPPGRRRRRWELIAVGFSFVMSISRVVLAAHWVSDVVVGTLFGAGIAIAVAAVVTEVRDLVFSAEGRPIPDDAEEPEPEELLRGSDLGEAGPLSGDPLR
jgi:undecaprenyl-diphosphatase